MEIFNNEVVEGKSAVAAGFFDTFHIGHRKVIESAKEYARNKNINFGILIFKPTKLIEAKEQVVFSLKERIDFAQQYKPDFIYLVDLDNGDNLLSPEEFILKLGQGVQVEKIFCGESFRYGKGALGKPNNNNMFNIVDLVKEGEVVSTTMIKSLLKKGDIEKANILLGKHYSVTGTIIRGHGVAGTALHTPTANFDTDENKIKLGQGVYAGFVIIDKNQYKALLSISDKRTLAAGSKILIEAHLLDFMDDLYGQTMTAKFVLKIRDIFKFDDFDSLYAAVQQDKIEAKDKLEGFLQKEKYNE